MQAITVPFTVPMVIDQDMVPPHWRSGWLPCLRPVYGAAAGPEPVGHGAGEAPLLAHRSRSSQRGRIQAVLEAGAASGKLGWAAQDGC